MVPMNETSVDPETEAIAAPQVEYPEAQVEDENEGWEDPAPVESLGQGDSAVATETPATPAAPAPASVPEERRSRGWLEALVEKLLKNIKSGALVVDDALLTPHFVSKKLTEVEGLPKAPSTGAVSAVFDRWVKIAAATMQEHPYAFIDFTDDAKVNGIAALKAAGKAAVSAKRKAEKEAKAAAEAAAAPPVEAVAPVEAEAVV